MAMWGPSCPPLHSHERKHYLPETSLAVGKRSARYARGSGFYSSKDTYIDYATNVLYGFLFTLPKSKLYSKYCNNFFPTDYGIPFGHKTELVHLIYQHKAKG